VHFRSCPIGIDCNLLGSLPDAQLSEVTHAESFIAALDAVTSFARPLKQMDTRLARSADS
jgi:hypothetical protein